MSPKHIVVLGGSHAGSAFIQLFEKLSHKKHADSTITLIDPRDGYYFNPAAPRAIVEAAAIDKIILPFSRLFNRAQHVQARATAIHTDKVLLDNGSEVTFDYLVIATGSSYPVPGKSSKDTSADILGELKGIHEAVKAANSILIVGGGPVGIEIAGEIATDFPTKKVTLVQGADKLLGHPDFKPKLQNTLQEKLEKLKVNVILNDRVPVTDEERAAGWKASSRTITTEKGVAIESDLQLFTVGNGKVNTEAVHTLGEVLNDKGRVKVKSTLQLESHANIYAIGDASAFDNNMLAFIAGQQGEIAAKNIFNTLEGKKLQEAKANGTMIFVTVGRNHGNAQLPFGVVGDWMVKRLKAKDMFLGKFGARAVRA